jgi:hypothetical protein
MKDGWEKFFVSISQSSKQAYFALHMVYGWTGSYFRNGKGDCGWGENTSAFAFGQEGLIVEEK